jgi:nucleotide-binding universal stress UspA family protein
MYKKILVPLDGSDLAECVLPHVESITKGCGVQGVVFLRVVEPFTATVSALGPTFTEQDRQNIDSQNRADAEKYLSQLVNHTKYGGVKIQREVMVGKAAESIADYATQDGVDLIIIATHGRSGVSRWVWGSVADRVLRSACVPVLMVRAPGCVPGI